ncbi:MAG: glutathione S-transferase N-terminal domain-containing protein [Pseudomonadota bacterium]
MTDNRNVLFSFSISHFCEKARWALELAGIDYTETTMIPGKNARLAKRLNLAQRTLPIFRLEDGSVIQEAAQITDFAAEQTEHTLLHGSCDIEKRLELNLGGPIAFLFYSAVIADNPQDLRSVFRDGLSIGSSTLLYAIWPMVLRAMISGMQLGPKQAIESQNKILSELDWLDHQFSDGRKFLAGDAPGREDLTAAALLALLIFPKEHPTYRRFKLPDTLEDFRAKNSDRASIVMINRLYRDYR